MQINQANIPPQHLEVTLHLMQLCDMKIDEAYQLLKLKNFSVEDAIAHKFNSPQKQARNAKNKSSLGLENSLQFFQYICVDSPEHLERPSRNIRQDKVSQKKKYEKTYLIKKKKQQGKARFTRNKKRDINEESDYKEKVEDFDFESALSVLIEGEVYVQFQGEVFEAFQKLWEERKLIAIHCLRFANIGQAMPLFEDLSKYAQEVYKIPAFVEVFNKYFINLGIDPARFDFSHFSFLRDLIAEGDQFSIILLRYDEPEQKVTVFKKLPFSSTFKLSAPAEFEVLVKKILLEESQQRSRARNGAKSISKAERRKLEEDRTLRQEQQQEYYRQLEQRNPAEEQPSAYAIQEEPRVTVAEQRRRTREALTIYPGTVEDGIAFKIRLPNGESLLLTLPRAQTISYIFQFVESYEKESLGFSDEEARKFDLILPLERVSLSQRKQETLQAVFGTSDMETLVVKQE